MVNQHGLSPEEALRAVCATAAYRDPAEAVRAGNATLHELISLLGQVAAKRSDRTSG
jgi:hypothetical protein